MFFSRTLVLFASTLAIAVGAQACAANDEASGEAGSAAVANNEFQQNGFPTGPCAVAFGAREGNSADRFANPTFLACTPAASSKGLSGAACVVRDGATTVVAARTSFSSDFDVFGAVSRNAEMTGKNGSEIVDEDARAKVKSTAKVDGDRLKVTFEWGQSTLVADFDCTPASTTAK